jgi:hypothetical protein
MALIRVAQYSSTPTVVGDYQAQNAHLQAFTNQLMTQQFILDAGIGQPVIKQGCYVSHGGSLYVADADTPITGSPSDGSVYIRVSGTTSLTVEFVNDISGYVWNPVYTALTSGSYTLLPYLIVKSGSTWTRYNFNPNNQAFGNAIIDGHDIDSELDTLNSRVNQAVNTTSTPTFLGIITTNGPNKPVDNNDASMPSVGIGGFSYAVGSKSDSGYPSVTIGSGGTWVYIAGSEKAGASSMTLNVGRISGGSSVQGVNVAGSGVTTYVHVIAWRIS